MKTMKLIYPLAFALAVTLAATGCNTNPSDVTPLPRGNDAAIVGNDTGSNTLPPMITDDT